MMIEIAVFNSHTGETSARRFTRSPVQIGRDPAADLCIAHACVSSHHAQVSFTDERAELIDLGSTNGTLYAGKLLPPRRPLAIPEEAIVTIGPIELQIRHCTATAEEVHLLAEIHAAMRRLRPLHGELVAAQARFNAARSEALERLPAENRGLAAAMFDREFSRWSVS